MLLQGSSGSSSCGPKLIDLEPPWNLLIRPNEGCIDRTLKLGNDEDVHRRIIHIPMSQIYMEFRRYTMKGPPTSEGPKTEGPNDTKDKMAYRSKLLKERVWIVR